MMTDLLNEHIALLEQMELHYLEKGDENELKDSFSDC